MKLTLSTKTAILIALLSFIGSLTYAQSGTPQYIDYQGRLLNSQGGPITSTGGPGTTGTAKNYEIEFRIWNSQTGGNLIFAEKQVVTVTDTGLFSVRIGEGDSITVGNPNTTDIHDAFNGPDRYLGITVDENNGNPVAEISPRLAFLNVPFAAVAEKAIAVKDGAITSAMIASQTITPGNLAADSINSSKIVNGTIKEEDIEDGAIDTVKIKANAVDTGKIAGSAVTSEKIAGNAVTSGKIADGAVTAGKLDSSIGVLGKSGSDVYHSGGRLGVGTATPSARVHISDGDPVNPSTNNANLIIEDDSGVFVQINSGDDNNAAINFSRDDANAHGQIKYSSDEDLEFSTDSTSRLIIKKDGKVGVGVAAPTTALHVDGNVVGASGVVGGTFKVGDPTGRFLVFDDNEIAAADLGLPGASTLFINTRGGDTEIGALGATTEIKGNMKVNGTAVHTSSRHLKEDFEEVDSEKVLDRLVSLPLSSWRYKGEKERRHVGPMSQDFHQAFDELLNLNSDDETIAPLDQAGVAFASIQELHKIVTEKDEKIEALEERLSRMEAMMKSLSKDDSVNQ